MRWKQAVRVVFRVTYKEAPIPYRSFFKTEWTKPKYVTKPYTTARENSAVSEDVEYEETLAQPYVKRAEETVPEHVKTQFSKSTYSNVKISNCCRIKKHVPATFFPLNLERLLNPPIASVAYILVRYFATDIDGNGNDVFWRPRARIPDENEMIRRLRDPDLSVRKKAEREAKYLFLNYGNIQYVKKKSNGPNSGQYNAPQTEQSVMSEQTKM